MFEWVLNMPFCMQANQLIGFYLIRTFTENYWNLDFNSNNSTVIPNFTLKKSKIWTKFIWQNLRLWKNPHKNDHREKKSWVEWSGISVIHQKHALTCPGLCRLIFQSLYHTSLISPKRESGEAVNFRNFRSRIFCGILAPHSQTGRTKRSDLAHEACCNGRHLDIWGSLMGWQ